jgi:hypothetical protein
MQNLTMPASYSDWHHCITVDCNILLTAGYIDARITALQDDKDFRTRQFVKLYGQQHRHQVIEWFEQARLLLI